MKRNNRTRRLAIALIELMRETTRLRRDVQYLFPKSNQAWLSINFSTGIGCVLLIDSLFISCG